MSRTEMAQRIRRAAGHTADSEMIRFERADLDERTVLAVDPSLGATGWAVLQHTERELAVRQYATVRYENLTNLVAKKAAARALYLAMIPEMDAVLSMFPDVELVVEAPPVGGGRMLSPESTWAAGTAVECAALAVGIPIREVMPIPKHKKLITDNGNADKTTVKVCLGLLAQGLPIVDYPHHTNSNVRDAVSVALADLHGVER